MTQYNSVNVNLSKLKHDRLKLAAKNAEKINPWAIIKYDC